MLLIYLEEQCLDEAERAQCYIDSARLAQELDANGQVGWAARSWRCFPTLARLRGCERQVLECFCLEHNAWAARSWRCFPTLEHRRPRIRLPSGKTRSCMPGWMLAARC